MEALELEDVARSVAKGGGVLLGEGPRTLDPRMEGLEEGRAGLECLPRGVALLRGLVYRVDVVRVVNADEARRRVDRVAQELVERLELRLRVVYVAEGADEVDPSL